MSGAGLSRWPVRPAPGAWINRGACRGKPADVFYSSTPVAGAYAEARAICAACPVRAECLQHAIDNRERYGFWGGLTAKERGVLLRGLPNLPYQAEPCGTPAAHRRHLYSHERPCEPCKAAWSQAQARRREMAS